MDVSKQRNMTHKPLDSLRFDLENPRLPSNVRRKGTEEAVLEWLLLNEKVVELMIAIGAKGYFEGEALFVVEAPKGSGTFRVVEGNRRLAAVKLLAHPELAMVRKIAVTAASNDAENKPNILPVVIFDDRQEILDYLGYRHITGTKAWDALAKARYLKQLFEWTEEPDLGKKCKTLAKAIGSKADYVQHLLTGLAIYEAIEDQDFFGIPGLSEESIDFSVLTTALSYNNIAEFLELGEYPVVHPNPARLEELTIWAFKIQPDGRTKLGESRNLKYLAAVVKNKPALEAFRTGQSLVQAAVYTEVPTNIYRNAVEEAHRRMGLANKYFAKAEGLAEPDADLLQEISTIASNLRTLILKQVADHQDEH